MEFVFIPEFLYEKVTKLLGRYSIKLIQMEKILLEIILTIKFGENDFCHQNSQPTDALSLSLTHSHTNPINTQM